MAALPLCTSWFPPSAGVAVAPHGARPISRVVHIHSPGRRGNGPSLLPIRIQARTPYASRFRCQKGPDHDHGPEPEPGRDGGGDEPDAAEITEISFADSIHASSDDIETQDLRKFHEAFYTIWRPRKAPDMLFCNEKDEISNYMIKISSSRANVQDVNSKVLSLFVCAEAQEALDLASMVMDLTYIESLNHGTIQLFDQYTSNMIIRNCGPIFLGVAKDAYLKRIDTGTVVSFLNALRGLGVFCDLLFQQMVHMLKEEGPLKNIISNTMGTHSQRFDKKMESLKQQFVESTDSTGIKHTVVMDTLFHGTKQAQTYILQMTRHRREALVPLYLAQEYARRSLLDGNKITRGF